MDYVGEHLMPGKLGQFFVVLSFAASLVATLSYFKSASAKSPDESASWKRMARFTFLLECSLRIRCLCNDLLYYYQSSISNTILPGNIPAEIWIRNICSVVSGKPRREVFYCG